MRPSSSAADQKDVAKARRLERSLRQSEERYALVSKAVAEGIYDWNIESNSLFVSPRLMEIFNFEGTGLTSADWNARVHPDDMESYRTALRDCFKQRSLKVECQYRIRAADGDYRWVEDHGLPIRNKAGRAIRLVGAISDVSRRHQMEQALRDSEQRYALAMQAINEGVYDWNIETGEIYYSPRVRDAVGLTPGELGSRADWLDRIHPDDLPAYKGAFAEHLKGKTDRFLSDYRYLHPDGTWHWARQHGIALRDQAGRAYRMAGSTGDITIEKNLASQRDAFLQELNAVLDTIDYGIVFMGPDLRAKIINRAFRQMWGISDEFIRETRPTMSDLINYNRHNNLYDVPSAQFDEYVARRVEAVRSGTTSTSEMRRLDGRIIQYQVLALPDGGRMLTYFDITDLKRSQEQLRQRTADLTELLAQQTATADVLKTISRSTFDLQVVLNTLVELAARLCDLDHAWLFRRDGEVYRWATGYGLSREGHEQIKQYQQALAHSPGRGSIVGRTALEGQPVQIVDVLADPEYVLLDLQKIGNYRTILGIPLLREGLPIGVLVLDRSEPRPFTNKQIELLTTFADQAVIAIENVRLFQGEQQRTRELSESLEQQTATSDVLRVISSSPADIQPVLETIGERAEKLCDAEISLVSIVDGELIRLASIHGITEAGVEAIRRAFPMRRTDETVTARAIRTRSVCHVADVLSDPQYQQKDAARVSGTRGCLGVPMVRDEQVVGAIFVARRQPGLFSETQVQLLKTFADQAVIAIENVRLFKETKISLEQQTATANVLKIISRSTFDLRTVLQTLVESAARFCNADKANIIREKDGVFYTAEAYGYSREFLDYIKNIPIKAERGSASGRALVEGRVVHITDAAADPEYTLVEARRLGDYRTILCVPMLREGVPIGLLVLTRSEVQPFTDEQIELVTTFADQAAIAIENVRLFEAEQQRTRELARSLENLRTAQDRLVQTEKLASLGQLTAGIAHEIKNPLNFVNNFSAVSVELIDELREALGGAHLDSKLRAEISEIADTLQSNLDKVVQHGKRADAIVKNMLLHSRQGSGEHRPVDINALVDESLNLAYHGARAEKQGFTITLETVL